MWRPGNSAVARALVGVPKPFLRESPYEPLDLGLSSGGEVYTEAVIHDTLGRRTSPSLLRAR